MKKIALAAACILAAPLAFAGPFDAFKGQVKPGMYETKVDMDMGNIPGMPPGMGKQSHTHQHCITQKDIDDGSIAKDSRSKNNDCQITDVKSSGNTGSWKMVCKNGTVADAKMTFTGSGYLMDMTTSMEQSGQKMTMKTHSESKYVGACK